MKKIIQAILGLFCRLILKKYQPRAIGITGSVGKTSAKIAIDLILSPSFAVRPSPKNYNTEIGVPLAVIGAENPGRSVWGWLLVFFHGLSLILKKDHHYPEVLILEMAADHPGDIGYLVDLIQPQIGVITAVGPTHLEFFGNVDNVFKEKNKLIAGIGQSGWAIINNDDPLAVNSKNNTQAKVVTFGLRQGADLLATDINLDKEKYSLNFKLNYHGSLVPVSLYNVLGRPAIYAVLSAAAVGLAFGLNLVEIASRLKNYQSPAGRLKLLSGIKNTKIIDDTYNASPLSVKAGLEVLSHLKCLGHKFAVLGDMLELGAETVKAHQEIGTEVAKLGIDYLVAVGLNAHQTAQAAKDYGFNEDRVYTFDNSLEAGKFIQEKIADGDLLLVKGSQGSRMERVVKEIMAEPERAAELLVRQGKEWGKDNF